MTALEKIRTRRIAWGRRALAAFSVVWFSFALQPCVMALGAGDGSGHPADHGTQQADSVEHHCPHCPPENTHHGGASASMQMPCADTTDCGDLDDFNYDGRKLDFDFESSAEPAFFLLPAAPPDLAAVFRDTRSRLATRVLHCGASPPLHLVNCVFLN